MVRAPVELWLEGGIWGQLRTSSFMDGGTYRLTDSCTCMYSQCIILYNKRHHIYVLLPKHL